MHWRRLVLLAAFAGVTACDSLSPKPGGRPDTARDFPRADRPIAPIISTRWSSEEERDRANEAEEIMGRAGIAQGMTVADIGAGEGYYTVRLAKRVGPQGRVLAQDIVAEVIDQLGRRVTRENWDNVSVKLGDPDDPELPQASFDRVFMVHMYHEVSEPYAFLWRLYPALKPDGQVIVVDADRPTEQHGTPPALLRCEFEAVGFKFLGLVPHTAGGAYMARFGPSGRQVAPGDIVPCRLARSGRKSARAGS